MANNIQLIEKYLPEVVDKVLATESKTALLENGQKFIDLNFKEAGYVRILSILMDGLSDYYRVNHVGVAGSLAYSHDNQNNGADYRDGYARGNASATWEIFQLQYDRGKQFLVDYIDNEETAGAVIANLLGEFLRTKVIPEIDALRFSKIAGKANAGLGNLVTETTFSSGILASWNTAFEWLTEHEVPEEDQVVFCNPSIYTALQNDANLTKYITQEDFRSERGVTFKLQAFNGRPIIVVPSDRFYTDIVIGANGYYPSADAKVINYIVCSKKAVIPVVKLNKSKVWTPEAVQDFDGYKVNVRIYHDVFVPKNKVPAIYVSVGNTTASTKASLLSLVLSTGSVQNAYVLDEWYTTPAGILGSVVTAQSAFTLGSTITVDGTTIKAVTPATDFVETNSSAYFALIDSANRVVAISGSVTLTGIKHV